MRVFISWKKIPKKMATKYKSSNPIDNFNLIVQNRKKKSNHRK
jgi:hypothetical protein